MTAPKVLSSKTVNQSKGSASSAKPDAQVSTKTMKVAGRVWAGGWAH